MSRSFSKRNSLLPPQTARELETLISTTPKKVSKGIKGEKEKGYDKKLHAYAIRMLAELEDAQKEVCLVSLSLLSCFLSAPASFSLCSKGMELIISTMNGGLKVELGKLMVHLLG